MQSVNESLKPKYSLLIWQVITQMVNFDDIIVVLNGCQAEIMGLTGWKVEGGERVPKWFFSGSSF